MPDRNDKNTKAQTEQHPRVDALGNSVSWLRCKLTAELTEDTHPGSGSGGNGVDALVATDRDRRPVIWATHAEGVLRDAARRLHGQEAAGALFGRAGGDRQRLVFTSLYMHPPAADSELHRDPNCRVWRSAARASFDNRAPQDETLRAIEFVPKGTRFEGLVELPTNDLPALKRLLAEVDAIGQGRASGAGRVTLTIAPVEPRPRSLGKVTSRLRLLLRNLDPVSITATATPTNIIPALPFVPGRSLLGAMANWLLVEGRQEAASTLVSGSVSVSDALPLPDEPANAATFEVSPAPLSLQSQKPTGTPGATPWWALHASPPARVDGWLAGHAELAGQVGGDPPPQLKRPEPDLFVYRAGPNSAWTAYRSIVRVRLRNGRSDPTQPDPSLFAVEQIAERTFFAAELRGDIAVMAVLGDALRPVLEGRRWLRIGRGGAPVEVVHADWVQTEPPVKVDGPAYLTLVSDLLIRDERLRWLKGLDPEKTEIFNWPPGAKAKPIRQDYTHVHGFNGTARLWRHPAVAVRRGSVFRVEAGVTELAQAAAGGKWLGERTHEGFGRFRLDTTLPGVTQAVTNAHARDLATSSMPDEAGEDVAVTTHGWFQAHRQLAAAATSSTPRPSLSQWLDLVTDLEREAPDALPSRVNPGTAGKRSWRDADARAVLDKIQRLPAENQSAHARMFVRWLRAAMRKRAS